VFDVVLGEVNCLLLWVMGDLGLLDWFFFGFEVVVFDLCLLCEVLVMECIEVEIVFVL